MKSPRQKGFTLIELLIVITIVAILAAIAIPSYSRYVTRTNRAAARACLMEYVTFMERYYTTRLTYVGGVPGALGCAAEAGVAGNYTFAADGIAQRTFTARATPVGSQATRDTECGQLTMNQANQRGVVGGSGTVAECWR
jgi:type IV pilus assembly protein PilE